MRLPLGVGSEPRRPSGTIASLIGSILLIVAISSAAADETEGTRFELREAGVGLYLGPAIPFGWFADKGFETGLTVGGYFQASLDSILPQFEARISCSYLSLESRRVVGVKHDFQDVSLLVQALRTFDLGLPLKPYFTAGLGLEYVSISRDEQGDPSSTARSEMPAPGVLFGAGAIIRPTDLIQVVAEARLHTSSWARGPGGADFFLDVMFGATFLLHL